MCTGEDCSLKEKCYRYKAKPDLDWQSYFLEPPIENGKCYFFWDNK